MGRGALESYKLWFSSRRFRQKVVEGTVVLDRRTAIDFWNIRRHSFRLRGAACFCGQAFALGTGRRLRERPGIVDAAPNQFLPRRRDRCSFRGSEGKFVWQVGTPSIGTRKTSARKLVLHNARRGGRNTRPSLRSRLWALRTYQHRASVPRRAGRRLWRGERNRAWILGYGICTPEPCLFRLKFQNQLFDGGFSLVHGSRVINVGPPTQMLGQERIEQGIDAGVREFLLRRVSR